MIKKLFASLIFLFFPLVSPVLVEASTLSLSPASGTFNPGCSFSVNILLNTGGVQTDGTDAVLFYEPSKLTPTITNGSIYPDYPGNSIDNQAGKISISGLSSVSSAYANNADAIFATINFQVNSSAPAGVTTVKFDFDPANPQKTTDSNVVQRGTVVDTLSSVINGNYTIGTGNNCAGTQSGTTLPGGGLGGPSASGSGTTQPSPVYKSLPNSGSVNPTMVLSGIGLIFVLVGLAGIAIL